MKALLKNLGLLLIIAGAGVLAVPFFQGTTTNFSLAIGLVIIILGLILYVLLNKFTD